jgi:Uma2 family endonuclease
MVVARQLTVEEYLALPEEPPYREYVNGEVTWKAMPNRAHMQLIFELSAAFVPYVKEHRGMAGPEGRARFDSPRGPEFRLPDFYYWATDKPKGTDTELLPPTLAVEVRSPDESLADQRDKCRYFRAYGVDVCWLIDPETRRVEVFEGGRDAEPLPHDAVLTSGYLPGFALPLAELFAVLDEDQ